MNRKKFIESQRATCQNWTWSWSFVNSDEKVIIFGAWDKHTEGNTSLILSESWQRNDKGRKLPGYKESREHIRLIEEEGYQLKTYPMIFSDERRDENGDGPAKIKDFIRKLSPKTLKRVGTNWYAS
jgi:5-methylcytosine-specific restriction protein A